MTTDRGRSIIFYPRSYNTRGENKKHSMLGVTESGKTINVKLRLDDKHEGKENAPSIKEFAKTDFLAKNPCIASDDNSAENSEGILLLSRCIKDNFDNDKGVEVYIARWAVVLSPSSQTPAPHKGVGRMEIKKDSSTVRKLKGLMRKSESENRLDDADAFKKQIEDPVSWSYPAIFYYPEQMVSFSLGNTKPLESKVAQDIDTLAKSGIVGGMAVRARNKSNEVVKETYQEIFSKFIISKTRYQDGIETFKSIVDELNETYGNDDYKWDAMPIKKINTGPASSRHYGSKDKLSFTRSMFTFDSNDEEPRLAKICARVSYFGDTDNTLLSRLYTISEPLDHPARLDKSGHFSLTFTGEGTKLAHLPSEDESIGQIKDGFSEDDNVLKRALWLLEGNVPIIRSLGSNSESESPTIEPLEESSGADSEDSQEESDRDESKEAPVPSPPTQPEEGEVEDDESEDPSVDESDFEFNEIEGESEDIEEKHYENASAKPKVSDEPEVLDENHVHKDDEQGSDAPDSDDKADADEDQLASAENEEESSAQIKGEHEDWSEDSERSDDETKEGNVESHDSDGQTDGRVSSGSSSEDRLKEAPSEAKEEKKLTGMAASLFRKK